MALIDISVTNGNGVSSIKLDWNIGIAGTYNINIKRKLASLVDYTTIVNLSNQSVTGSYTDSNVSDINPPDPVAIKFDSIVYNYQTKSLTVPIEAMVNDNNTLYDYIITAVNTVDGNIIESDIIRAYVNSGIKAYAVKVDNVANTTLISTDSIGIVSSKNFTIANDTSLNYIHTATIDNSNNISDTSTTTIDLSPPPKVTSWKINDISITSPLQLLSFTVDKLIASTNAVTQTRGMEVLYDISLYNTSNSTIVSSIIGSKVVSNIDLLIKPFTDSIINSNSVLRLDIKTYTVNGSSMGIASSNTFKIDYNDPLTVITFTNTPSRLLDTNNRDTANITLTWSVSNSDVYPITGYFVEFRKRYSSSNEWSAWTAINATVHTPTTINIPYTALGMTGANIYEFRIRSINSNNGYSSYFNFPYYFADLFVLKLENTNQLVTAIRLPIEVLRDVPNIRIETRYNGTLVYTSPNVNIVNNEIQTAIGDNKIGVIATYNIESGETIFDSTVFNSIKSTISDTLDQARRLKDYSSTSKPLIIDYNSLESDIYLIGSDLTSSSSVLSAVTYTYTELVGVNSTFTSTLLTDKTGDLTKNIVSKYNLLKYSTVNPPVLSYYSNYTPVGSTNNIDDFLIDIAMKSEVGTAQLSIPNLTVETSYDFIVNGDYSTFPNYVNGTLVTQPGTYNFYSRVIYTNSQYDLELLSEESVKSFNILDDGSLFILPSFRKVYNSVSQGIDLYIDLNIDDISGYTYTIKNNTTVHTYIPAEYTVTADQYSNISYKLPLYAEGNFEIEVIVSFGGMIESLIENVNVFKFGETVVGDNILNQVIKKKSLITDNSPMMNNALLDTNNSLDTRNNLYALKVTNSVNSTSKTTLVSNNYQIPVFVKGSAIIDKYLVNINNRNVVYSHDGRNSTINVISTTSNNYKKVESQNVDLSTIDNTIPSVPLVTVSSITPLTPFSANGSTDCVAKNTITFNVTNINNLYTTKILIDGNVWANNTPYTTTGEHTFLAIFTDNHNYTLNYKKINFEVVKDYLFSPPIIDYSPKSGFSSNYTIDISYNNLTQEDGMVFTNEYKLSSDNIWKAYTVPFSVNQPMIITARKRSNNGMEYLDTFEITDDMLGSIAPVAPVISAPSLTGGNNSIFIPSIKKEIGLDYTWKLNSINYTEGTPITNYDSTIRNFKLEVTATDSNTGDYSLTTLNFVIDTLPPLNPTLKNVVDKSIMDIDGTFVVGLDYKEPNVDYNIVIDGQIIENNTPLSSIPSIAVNGTHVLSIYARKTTNNMVSFNSYIIDINNYPTTNSLYTIDNNRISLIPLNRESGYFDTPNELVVDTNTGDISVVTSNIGSNGYVLDEITKNIKKLLEDSNSLISQMERSINFQKERSRYLKDNADQILINNSMIDDMKIEVNNTVNEYLTLFNNLKISVNNNTIGKDSLVASVNSNVTLFNNNVAPLFNGLDNNVTSSNTLRTTLLSYFDSYNDVMTKLALSDFNLNSINIEANKKVLTSEFNSFKNKHLSLYYRLTDIVASF